MLKSLLTDAAAFFLLAFPALFSIINPVGGAFIFLAATHGMPAWVRRGLARKVATYSFVTLILSMLVGAFVLRFFGISMPVLRLAGGIVIALSGWRILNAPEERAEREAVLEEAADRDAAHLAFYPLTMPVTTGPGTISVAIALGTGSAAGRNPVLFAVQALATSALICLLIFVLYATSSQLARVVGPTGTNVIARLSAFLLFCIGVQVLWTGLAELLSSLPHEPA
jgi:multiple antibiotic resistance protein